MKVAPIDPKYADELKRLIDEVTTARGAVAIAKFAVVELTMKLCTIGQVDPKTSALSECGLYLIEGEADFASSTPLLSLFDRSEG